jgi:hypothetical protein
LGDLILKINYKLLYRPGEGIEVRLKPEGNLTQDVIRHLSQAGKEVSLALHSLAGLEMERPEEEKKARTKIEIEEV